MPQEKDFQTKFNRWLKYNWNNTSAFELKIVKTKSMPFNVVKNHQLDGLKLVGSKFIYKIADDSQGIKPFDCFTITEASAYIVIMFYKRGQKEFIMIEVSNFIKEKNISKRKSLTEERAKQIGIINYLK